MINEIDNINEEIISELDLFLQLTTKKMNNGLGLIYKLNLIKDDDIYCIRATVFDENDIKITKILDNTETKKILAKVLKIEEPFEITDIIEHENSGMVKVDKFNDIIIADIEDNNYLKNNLLAFANFHTKDNNIEFKKYIIQYKLL